MSDAIDYAEMAADAKALIEANGRACTFSRLARDPADTNKPWRGMTGSTGATHPPVSYANVIALIFPEEFKVGKGEVARTGYETCLVAHGSFPGGAVDPVTLDTVSDGSRTWKIVSVHPLIPGSTSLIHQFTLEN